MCSFQAFFARTVHAGWGVSSSASCSSLMHSHFQDFTVHLSTLCRRFRQHLALAGSVGGEAGSAIVGKAGVRRAVAVAAVTVAAAAIAVAARQRLRSPDMLLPPSSLSSPLPLTSYLSGYIHPITLHMTRLTFSVCSCRVLILDLGHLGPSYWIGVVMLAFVGFYTYMLAFVGFLHVHYA